MKSLLEITGQESGIIVYGDEVMALNWSNMDGLPILMTPLDTPIGKGGTNTDISKTYTVEDIRTELPGTIITNDEGDLEAVGMDIIYDDNGDFPALWGYDIGAGAYIETDDEGNLIPTSGEIYCINGGVVIAPDGWH